MCGCQIRPRHLISGRPFCPAAESLLMAMQLRKRCTTHTWIETNALEAHRLGVTSPHPTVVWLPRAWCESIHQQSNATRSRWMRIINAAFVEETDLVLLLTSGRQHKRTSPNRTGLHSPTLYLRDESVMCVEPTTPIHSWISIALPTVKEVLADGRAKGKGADDGHRRSSNCDPMVALMAPPLWAGAAPHSEADNLWIEDAIVHRHQLTMYRDAYYSPCMLSSPMSWRRLSVPSPDGCFFMNAGDVGATRSQIW